MKGKKLKIIVMAGLAVVSFALAFVATGMLHSSMSGGTDEGDPAAMEEPTADQELLKSLAETQAGEMKPKEKHLSDLIKEVRAKMQQLDRKELELSEREQRLELATTKLRDQAKEIETLRMKLVAAMTPLNEARQELLSSYTVIEQQEEQNLENTARMWAKMDPASAARIIVEMFKADEKQAATKIIRYMSDKSWAAIMDEIVTLGSQEPDNPAMEIILKQLKVIRDSKET